MGYIDLPNDNIPLVLIGDVFECLKKIPPETISCIVTSPPYWKHRDYYIKNQIGQEETAEEYIDKMANVSGELLRVLRKDGAYFLNIGDTYIDKGLQMIPQRLATKMIKNIKITALNKTKIGWLLRNQIIWYKPNHMPSPAKVRFTNTYEPICFFTRDDWERKVYFDIDSIRIPYKSDESIENNLGLPLTIGEREYKRWQPIIKKKSEEFMQQFGSEESFEEFRKELDESLDKGLNFFYEWGSMAVEKQVERVERLYKAQEQVEKSGELGTE